MFNFLKTTTTVALKMLKDPSQLVAFTSEANMLLGLSHANIVQVEMSILIFVDFCSFMGFT